MVMKLPFLETMITQVCNLSCYGCTNYSDLTHSGYVSWDEGEEQLQEWLKKIEIEEFGIMGGEPLINPEVDKWLIGTRRIISGRIRFTTNGELLNKHMHVVDLAHQLGNVVFKITVHRNDDLLENTINQIFDMYNWEPVTEFGINRYKTTNNFRFQINRPTTFLKTYKNNYENMMPYDSDPNEAFKICVQQKCPLLYKGKIYKCSTAGLLKDLLTRFNWPNKQLWEKYIDKGISPGDSDETIKKFIDSFGKANLICGQCPEEKEAKINHILNVIKK
jgi:organic radical activating enzyme